jgi:hypothetical protein
VTETTTFSIQQVSQLRRRAQRATKVNTEGPQGWSKSDVDPMSLLSAFSSLRLREGFTLRAYQFREGGNGNGVVWALPADAPFPEPDACPKLKDRFLEPPCPPGALDDVMEAIEGDGSPRSYLSASLFAREAAEFGAMWHGCDWSTHTIIRAPPAESSEWEWAGKQPVDWQPRVRRDDEWVIVTFFTHSALGQEMISQHTDTYKQDSYCFTSESKIVATGPGGYVF